MENNNDYKNKIFYKNLARQGESINAFQATPKKHFKNQRGTLSELSHQNPLPQQQQSNLPLLNALFSVGHISYIDNTNSSNLRNNFIEQDIYKIQELEEQETINIPDDSSVSEACNDLFDELINAEPAQSIDKINDENPIPRGIYSKNDLSENLANSNGIQFQYKTLSETDVAKNKDENSLELKKIWRELDGNEKYKEDFIKKYGISISTLLRQIQECKMMEGVDVKRHSKNHDARMEIKKVWATLEKNIKAKKAFMEKHRISINTLYVLIREFKFENGIEVRKKGKYNNRKIEAEKIWKTLEVNVEARKAFIEKHQISMGTMYNWIAEFRNKSKK